jgi:hypothetical protein
MKSLILGILFTWNAACVSAPKAPIVDEIAQKEDLRWYGERVAMYLASSYGEEYSPKQSECFLNILKNEVLTICPLGPIRQTDKVLLQCMKNLEKYEYLIDKIAIDCFNQNTI